MCLEVKSLLWKCVLKTVKTQTCINKCPLKVQQKVSITLGLFAKHLAFKFEFNYRLGKKVVAAGIRINWYSHRGDSVYISFYLDNPPTPPILHTAHWKKKYILCLLYQAVKHNWHYKYSVTLLMSHCDKSQKHRIMSFFTVLGWMWIDRWVRHDWTQTIDLNQEI